MLSDIWHVKDNIKVLNYSKVAISLSDSLLSLIIPIFLIIFEIYQRDV